MNEKRIQDSKILFQEDIISGKDEKILYTKVLSFYKIDNEYFMVYYHVFEFEDTKIDGIYKVNLPIFHPVESKCNMTLSPTTDKDELIHEIIENDLLV